MALPNLTIGSGVFTMETRKALQRHIKYMSNSWYPYAIDGDFGRDSRKGLQHLMKYHGWYTRAIDGDFGYYSCFALHKFLRTTWQCPYLQYSAQAQYYVAPWNPWTAGEKRFVQDVTKALQSGLNRHGKY